MIEARLAASAGGFVVNLARKAAMLAETALASRRQASTDPARWRDARLLWPLFTKD
ncbi:MAG: hypothetical protein KDE25_01750 [Novosphingobium sp.]|nr:hypothetical protein [Novosphingobium sp.]